MYLVYPLHRPAAAQPALNKYTECSYLQCGGTGSFTNSFMLISKLSQYSVKLTEIIYLRITLALPQLKLTDVLNYFSS